MIYLIGKSLHLLAMVIWLGGMIFVPVAIRSFRDSQLPQDLLIKLSRVFALLCTPAMIAVWAVGLFIASAGGWLSDGWLLTKLAVVLVLSGLHGAMVGQLRRAATSGGSLGVLRNMHLPVIGMLLLIILLAVIRPF